MKKILSFILIALGVLAIACHKVDQLATYTPANPVIFSDSTLKHTVDSVNVGDTVYLAATGSMIDTTQKIYAYITASSSLGSVYTWGSASSPVTLSRTIGAQNSSGLYSWTSTIALPGVTPLHKSKLTITAYFIYQLNLSSEMGVASLSDGGGSGTTKGVVYVK